MLTRDKTYILSVIKKDLSITKQIYCIWTTISNHSVQALAYDVIAVQLESWQEFIFGMH
jgi:hypothetical protein